MTENTQGNSDWLETYGLALTDMVACDTVNCERPGAFFAKVNCCGAVVIGCVECMQEVYKTIQWMRRENKYIMCKECGKSNSPEGWITRPEKL